MASSFFPGTLGSQKMSAFPRMSLPSAALRGPSAGESPTCAPGMRRAPSIACMHQWCHASRSRSALLLPAQDGSIMREVDAIRVQLPQTLDAGIGRTGRERPGVLRRLTDDEHQAVASTHGHRLVAGRVARCREDAHAFHDLAIAFDCFIARFGEVDPLDDRVALTQCEVELGLLDMDRHAWERAVLSAVVEMQVAVDDREHPIRV